MLISRLGLILLTQLHVHVTGCSCVHVRVRFMSLNINTLGLSPVTVADNSIRKASSGGVAANKRCSLPVLICFAISLVPRFMCCLSPLLWSIHFTLMGAFLVFSKQHSSMGLFSYTFIFLHCSISSARAFATLSGSSS